MIAPNTQHFECLALPTISVVICTYNRAYLLPDLLKSLSEQTLEKSEYEVIVTDNNSTDDTRDIIERFSIRYPNINYCFEERLGASYARNHGLSVARGHYVSLIDDDCTVPAQWLAVAKEVIEHHCPAVFGGPFYPFYNTPKPPWFKDIYGSYDLGNEARPLLREFLYGGNSFYKRVLLLNVGGFNNALGPIGDKLGYGEDVAPQILIQAKNPGELFFYDPRLYVYHLVRPEKMTMRWLLRSSFTRGKYVYRLFKSKDSPVKSKQEIMKSFVTTLRVIAVDFFRNIFWRDRTRYPYIQNYLYENTLQYLQKLGSLYEQYRQVIQQSESSIECRE